MPLEFSAIFLAGGGAWGALCAAWWRAVCRRAGWRTWDLGIDLAAFGAMSALAGVLMATWPWAIGGALVAVIGVIIWRRPRRKQRGSDQGTGSGRATIAGLVRAMRDRARPRRVTKPVLRPAPGGAW